MLHIRPLQMGWDCAFEQGVEEWLKVFFGPPVNFGESSLLSDF